MGWRAGSEAVVVVLNCTPRYDSSLVSGATVQNLLITLGNRVITTAMGMQQSVRCSSLHICVLSALCLATAVCLAITKTTPISLSFCLPTLSLSYTHARAHAQPR